MKKLLILTISVILLLSGCIKNKKEVHICDATINHVKYQTSLYSTDDKITKIISRVITEINNEEDAKLFTAEAISIESQLEGVSNVLFNYELTDKLYTQTYTFETSLMTNEELNKYITDVNGKYEYISIEKSLEKLENLGFNCQIRP